MDSPGLDDSELLPRARVDADAFGAFCRRHARAVYRSLLAETFARALQSIGRFRGLRVTSGRAWTSPSRTRLCCTTSASTASRIAPGAAWASCFRPAKTFLPILPGLVPAGDTAA